MLSNKDLEYLQKYAYCMNHNVNINKMVFGEPFLSFGILHYFDGKMLIIDGLAMPFGLNQENAYKNIFLVVKDFLKNKKAMIVSFFGHKLDLSPALPKNFGLILSENFDEYNRIMQIDFSKEYKYSKSIRKTIRAAKKNGAVVDRVKRSEFDDEHKEFIKNFVLKYELDNINKATIYCLQDYIKEKDVVIFEGRKDGFLKGFLIVDTIFKKVPIHELGLYDHGCKGIADLIRDASITFARKGGAEVIDFGYSVNQSIFEHKLLLGTNRIIPPLSEKPYGFHIWAKPDTNIELNSPWWWKLDRPNLLKKIGSW